VEDGLVSLKARLGEIIRAIRAARFPPVATGPPSERSVYTGKRSLVRSWMREGERVASERRENRDRRSGGT